MQKSTPCDTLAGAQALLALELLPLRLSLASSAEAAFLTAALPSLCNTLGEHGFSLVLASGVLDLKGGVTAPPQ